MEITIERAVHISSSNRCQSNWLKNTISSVDEKLKTIVSLLNDDKSSFQNAEKYDRAKAEVMKTVQELCLSYCSLAEKFDRVTSVPTNAISSVSSSPLNDEKLDQYDITQKRSVDSESSVFTISNPESTVEDGDTEDENHDKTLVLGQHAKTSSDHKAAVEVECNLKFECAWSNADKLKMLKLVEENTQLQVELIKRNSEKRETIRKLQNEVNKLMADNNELQHRLSCHESYKQLVQVKSLRSKTVIVDRLFRCS